MIDKEFDVTFFGIDDDPDIDSICLNCGLEERMPGFIYDEFGRYIEHKELNNKKVCTINCNRCEKEKVVPKNNLDKESK